MRPTPIAIAFSVLALCSCIERGAFSPEEVLHRSSVANSGMLSARVMMDAQITSSDEAGSLSATLNVQGNMQEGGRQLDLVYATQGTRNAPPVPATWQANGRFIALSGTETYIRADTLNMSPASLIPGIADAAALTGEWFRLPSSGQAEASITPDPRFLRLQSDVVRVTKDHGIVTLNGRRMYRYDVTIDPVRLAAYLNTLPGEDAQSSEAFIQQLAQYTATGNIWIDEETFLLTKAMWTIERMNDSGFSLILSLELSDVGLPVTISAPENAQPFPVFTPGDALILQEF